MPAQAPAPAGRAEWRRSIPAVLCVVVALAAGLLRFAHVEADFPAGMLGAADEGTYARNAVRLVTTGDWHVATDYNTAVNYPVFTAMQGVVFSLFGPSLSVARSVSGVLSLLSAGLVALLVYRSCGARPALLASTLLLTNAMYFHHSRLAHLDMPMSVLVLASFLVLLWRRDPPVSWCICSSVLLCLAGLTKTSAVFALPVAVAILWRQSRPGRPRAVGISVFIATGLVFALVYVAGVLLPYRDDYARVAYAAVGRRMSVDPSAALWGGLRIFLGGTSVGPILFAGALGAGTWLGSRRDAGDERMLARVCLSWIFLYLLVMSMGSRAPSRYYIPIVVPVVVLVALGAEALLRESRERLSAVVAMIVMTAVVGSDLLHIGHGLDTATFTLRDAARDIGARVRRQAPRSPLLLGTSSGVVGLLAGLPSVGAHFGLLRAYHEEFDLSLHRPTHLVTRGAMRPWQEEAVVEHGYEAVWLAKYTVVGNFVHPTNLSLYRLARRKPATPVTLDRSEPTS